MLLNVKMMLCVQFVCMPNRLDCLLKLKERATKPLQIIHLNLCGPIDPETYDGKRFSYIHYTHFCMVYLLANKSKVEKYSKQYLNEVEFHFDQKICKVRSNGSEYCSENLEEWYKMKGIIMNYTVLYSPQLNVKAERINLISYSYGKGH